MELEAWKKDIEDKKKAYEAAKEELFATQEMMGCYEDFFYDGHQSCRDSCYDKTDSKATEEEKAARKLKKEEQEKIVAKKEAEAKIKLDEYMNSAEEFYKKCKPTKTKIPFTIWRDAGDYEGEVVNNTPHG